MSDFGEIEQCDLIPPSADKKTENPLSPDARQTERHLPRALQQMIGRMCLATLAITPEVQAVAAMQYQPTKIESVVSPATDSPEKSTRVSIDFPQHQEQAQPNPDNSATEYDRTIHYLLPSGLQLYDNRGRPTIIQQNNTVISGIRRVRLNSHGNRLLSFFGVGSDFYEGVLPIGDKVYFDVQTRLDPLIINPPAPVTSAEGEQASPPAPAISTGEQALSPSSPSSLNEQPSPSEISATAVETPTVTISVEQLLAHNPDHPGLRAFDDYAALQEELPWASRIPNDIMFWIPTIKEAVDDYLARYPERAERFASAGITSDMLTLMNAKKTDIESGGNAFAVSVSEAIGLEELMPSHHFNMAIRLGYISTQQLQQMINNGEITADMVVGGKIPADLSNLELRYDVGPYHEDYNKNPYRNHRFALGKFNEPGFFDPYAPSSNIHCGVFFLTDIIYGEVTAGCTDPVRAYLNAMAEYNGGPGQGKSMRENGSATFSETQSYVTNAGNISSAEDQPMAALRIGWTANTRASDWWGRMISVDPNMDPQTCVWPGLFDRRTSRDLLGMR